MAGQAICGLIVTMNNLFPARVQVVGPTGCAVTFRTSVCSLHLVRSFNLAYSIAPFEQLVNQLFADLLKCYGSAQSVLDGHSSTVVGSRLIPWVHIDCGVRCGQDLIVRLLLYYNRWLGQTIVQPSSAKASSDATLKVAPSPG